MSCLHSFVIISFSQLGDCPLGDCAMKHLWDAFHATMAWRVIVTLLPIKSLIHPNHLPLPTKEYFYLEFYIQVVNWHIITLQSTEDACAAKPRATPSSCCQASMIGNFIQTPTASFMFTLGVATCVGKILSFCLCRFFVGAKPLLDRAHGILVECVIDMLLGIFYEHENKEFRSLNANGFCQHMLDVIILTLSWA